MDADLEIRVTRSGQRARQLVIIPDADISEAEAESEDDVDDLDYGTTVPTVSQDDESDLSTDDDDIPSANLFQTTEPTSSKSRNKNGHNFRWHSMNQSVVDTTWKYVLPDCPDEVGTPISYFGQFFTPDMMQLIVEETNRYAVQNGSRFRINMQNLETYVGILLRMGIVHMPRYRMYWSSELRYNAIADYMSRNMFEDIGRFIHFNDNSKVITNRKDQNYDSLYKIRPLLEKLRQQCLLVAPKQTVD
ncbi:PiggyBac transposable element-derived protein 3 [Biomphalaria pfeifferi]|uniref:PiggyBac transposable element-derived protein 3 n=1 Tax=Biomphalaria pfeifferi TaxID=112525 RepID=A0AAD8B154_BIOPF|nr:PiggyBac transposable element-derived protein 3 [Biomphalaria pfeifferi]